MFPSPCGEKVGINVVVLCLPVLLEGVSVPLRGKGRDQQQIIRSVRCEYIRVSVPLRGKGRDQQSPSPTGVAVKPPRSFRPLAGKR